MKLMSEQKKFIKEFKEKIEKKYDKNRLYSNSEWDGTEFEDGDEELVREEKEWEEKEEYQKEKNKKFINRFIEEVELGFENGLSIEQVKSYAYLNHPDKKEYIREALQDGLSVEDAYFCAKLRHSSQIKPVIEGLKAGMKKSDFIDLPDEYNNSEITSPEIIQALVDTYKSGITDYDKLKIIFYSQCDDVSEFAELFKTGLSDIQLEILSDVYHSEDREKVKSMFEDGKSVEEVEEYIKEEGVLSL